MKEASSKSSESLPAYSERPIPSPPLSLSPYSPFPSLLQSVNKTRGLNIRTLISTHIHPHLQASAVSGLSKTILVLIPSNISSLQPRPFSPLNPNSGINDTGSEAADTFPGESVIGFSSAENLSLVRLHGAENTLEFWRQEAVIRELDSQLKDDLRRGGHRILGDVKQGGSSEELQGTSMAETLTKKISFRAAEWRFAKEEALRPGEVSVGVEFKEVCLRVENEMGLFETRGGKAIVIRVEVGG